MSTPRLELMPDPDGRHVWQNMRRLLEWSRSIASIIDAVPGQIPVGGLFLTIDPTDPSETLGYGTWEPLAEGRMVISVDPNNPELSSSLLTGGSL